MAERARVLLGFAVALLMGAPVQAQCPEAAETAQFLRGQPLERASRSYRFGSEVPWGLYEKALESPGTPVPLRTGSRVQGVMLVEEPAEAIWQALNDEPHHDEGDYLPLRYSEVVGGRPGHSDREVFQYYIKAGFGRWWVNRMELNDELFAMSGGVLWELSWRDVMADYRDSGPPVRLGASVRGIENTLGAWLLAKVDDRCTLMEYVGDGDPGGLAGALQWMALTRTMRQTMLGIVAMATQHLEEPHPRGLFVRPDGTSMDPPAR